MTLDDLTFALSPALGSPLGGAGCAAGASGCGAARSSCARLQVVRGVRVSGVLTERGRASLRISGGAAAAGVLRVSPRGTVRGRLGGKPVRARLHAGPPRPVAGGARIAAKTAQFRHRAAFSSVRPRS